MKKVRFAVFPATCELLPVPARRRDGVARPVDRGETAQSRGGEFLFDEVDQHLGSRLVLADLIIIESTGSDRFPSGAE